MQASPIWHPLESMVLANKFHEAYPVLFQGGSRWLASVAKLTRGVGHFILLT